MRVRQTGRGRHVIRASGLTAVCLACVFFIAAPASAKSHEARIALHDGKAGLGDVSAVLCRELGVDAIHVPGGSLDLTGLNGSNFIAAVNESLGGGCRVTITPDALVLHLDPDKLPKDCDAAKRAVRIFTAVEAPEATAAQRKSYGLRLPDPVDAKRPMAVLVHGMDSDQQGWAPLAGLLGGAGYQVAYFVYASDGPVADSGDELGRRMTELRRAYPALTVDLICHSMGGLVARSYVEGPNFAGGVGRLILCGTPNAGSNWARWRIVLEAQEHYHLWRSDPNWSPTWMVTDGLGEAGDDVKPGSAFLTRLNAGPRRDGVRYTVVAGNQHAARSTCADWWDCSARTLVPGRTQRWWGFRQCRAYMEAQAVAERAKAGDSDGPVRIDSTKLAGVSDFVVVHADHISLCYGERPAVWDVIRERMGN